MQQRVNVRATARPRVGAVPAEMFFPPSDEALRILRWFPDLMSPRDGRGSWVARTIRAALVAPNTQLTLLSFELQAFLFNVFHRSFISRFGHLAFMTTCNFFAMLLFAQWSTGSAHEGQWFALNGAWAYAALLFVWYAAAAASNRLWLWAGLMAPFVGGLAALATHTLETFRLADGATVLGSPLPLWLNPWIGMAVSAFLIAASHGAEPKLPPRASDPLAWKSIPEFVGEPRLTLGQRVSRALRVGSFLIIGTFDEWWASPRLMAYNYLVLMMEAGYAPAVYARLREWTDRALESGNPALDYVGIGGGSFLAQDG